MKKLIVFLLILSMTLAFTSTVRAEKEVNLENEINTLNEEEILSLFFMFLERVGSTIYLNSKYCKDENFQAGWFSISNSLVVCDDNISKSEEKSEKMFRKIIFHEMVHAAQDCLAGFENEKLKNILSPMEIDSLIYSLDESIINKFKEIYPLDHMNLEIEAYFLENYPIIPIKILYGKCLPE